MNPRIILLALCSAFLSTSCSFVQRTPGGEKVRVLAVDEVTTCRKITKITVAVPRGFAGLGRPSEAIAEDLRNEARNGAADAGGDTIVPSTTAVSGRQSFNIYKCIDPNSP